MDEEIAGLLLSKSLITQDLLSSDQDTLELLQQLAFLPLAIVQAAAYINKNAVTFADYVSLLKSQEQDVIDLLSEDFEDEEPYREKKNPIATTWLVSFEHIRQLDPLAAKYLSFMCCIHPRDIPESLLPSAQSRKKEMDAIGTLSAYSFVSRPSADNSLDLHRLVHLATRNWLRKEESLAKWTLRVAVRLGKVFPMKDHENRSLRRTYFPHAQYLLDASFIEDDAEEKVELLWKCGACLFHDRRYNDAEKRFLPVVEINTRLHGEEHPNTLSSIINLAATYWEQGRLEEAEELEVQVIEIRERVLGKEHPDTLMSMHNLALTYFAQGRWKEAEKLGLQVLEMKKRVLGEEHPNTLDSMYNLALTYTTQGRWKEAEELEVQVMELRKRVLGEEHPDTLTSMNNLAIIWKSLGRDIEALRSMEKCLELRNQKLGADHPYTIGSRKVLLKWKAVDSVVKA